MKLAVCGCSFSATVSSVPGTHWSEILAEHLGAELINLAQRGCSNRVIRLQIDEAIKSSPDLVIVSATIADRIEWPTSSAARPRTLKDMQYGNNNHNMRSTSISSVVNSTGHPVTEERKQAVEQYLLHLYDTAWQDQIDNWVLTSGLWTMVDMGINFLYNPWFINSKATMPKHLVDRHYLPYRFRFNDYYHEYKLTGLDDPGYHISAEGQCAFAERLLDYIRGKEIENTNS
jgi:hypothetical protein